MAGLIPQSFINDLIDRVDIVDVIDGRVALKKTGKNYRVFVHSTTKSPRLFRSVPTSSSSTVLVAKKAEPL